MVFYNHLRKKNIHTFQMKLNIKKMKLNQVVLIIALIVVITWMVMRSKGRVEYNEGEKQMTQEELDTIMKFVKGTK